MNTWRDGTATVLILVLTLSLAAAPADARLVRGPRQSVPATPAGRGQVDGNELVFEGGLAEPLGDQTDDFWTSETGIGSTTGYELGLRYRYYGGSNWAVSPSFHYVRFGSFSGVGDFPEGEDLGFDIRSSLYRYGVDLQLFVGSPHVALRPYLTGGVALSHNIYRDELQYHGVFSESVDAPSFNAGVGLKLGIMELSGEYHFNRFDTSKFGSAGETVTYNWDYAVFRVGFAFGRY